jgi:Baseplate J-like protein
MSTCNTTSASTNCPCDDFVHPVPLDIAAGLSTLPRQIATFPEFRRAMLLAISEYGPLDGWQADRNEDLGVLLIEAWAYVCDVLSFYDSVIAQEAYLRTAQLRPSVRKLVDLIGYLPRPATAATVSLAALASGRQPITLPKGTAFKSKAFDAEPPQTFELDVDTVIHPFLNKLELARVPYLTLDSTNPATLTVLPVAEIKIGDILAVINRNDATDDSAHTATQVTTTQGDDGVSYTEITLSSNSKLDSNDLLSHLSIRRPSASGLLWTSGSLADAYSTSGLYTTTFYMDRIYDQIRAGERLVVQIDDEYYPARASVVTKASRAASSGNNIVISGSTFNLPSVTVSVTRVVVYSNNTLTTMMNGVTEPGRVVIHFATQLVAHVTREPRRTLTAANLLALKQVVESPLDEVAPTGFLLLDKNNNGQALEGDLRADLKALDVPDTHAWTQTLYAPVNAYANLVEATRGESVKGEVLGSGNASMASQSFKLKKKPLTYLLSPTLDNDQGVTAVLEVWINNIRWYEVSNFYLSGASDLVYIVRQDDEGESWITFGDGVRGSRLPSGNSNVVVHYSFGAGEAAPPAGYITQIGKPVTGLQSVLNPVAATPGGDAEAQEDIRENAPQSILILGRAISMKDMEAVALGVPGVRVATAEWRWSGTVQRATAHIWYVGDAALAASIEARLRNVTEPSTPFSIHVSQARRIQLHIGIHYDPSYDPTTLQAAIVAALLDPDYGFLLPESLGVGQPIFRSQLFAAILAVAGVTGIQTLLWSEASLLPTPWAAYGKRQHAGHHWDFETTPPLITLTEDNL